MILVINWVILLLSSWWNLYPTVEFRAKKDKVESIVSELWMRKTLLVITVALPSSTSTPNYFLCKKKLHKNVWRWRKKVRKYKVLLPRWARPIDFVASQLMVPWVVINRIWSPRRHSAMDKALAYHEGNRGPNPNKTKEGYFCLEKIQWHLVKLIFGESEFQ